MALIALFATFGAKVSLETTPGRLKALGLGLMLLSVIINVFCIWSLSNWKYNVRTGLVTDGARMRLDLELTGAIASGSFLIGLTIAVLASIAPSA